MRQEQEAKGRLVVSHLACFHLVLPVRLPDTRAPSLYYFFPLPLGSWPMAKNSKSVPGPEERARRKTHGKTRTRAKKRPPHNTNNTEQNLGPWG